MVKSLNGSSDATGELHLLSSSSKGSCSHLKVFRINEFNVTSVLALMLPYHETPQFAQMLQLLHLEYVL